MATRQERIVIRLNADMKRKLQAMAAEMGITMSALGAYVLGQWVINQEKTHGRIEKGIKEVISDAVRSEGDPEGLEDFLNDFVPQFLSGWTEKEGRKRSVP